MPCQGITAQKLPCAINPKKGAHYCHIHERMNQRRISNVIINESKPIPELLPQLESNDKYNNKSELSLANDMLEEQVATLKNQLAESESKVKKMNKDFNAYQTIRKYQSIYEKLCDMYRVSDNYELNNAIKSDPDKAISLLGSNPHFKFNSLRIERNNLCHAIVY